MHGKLGSACAGEVATRPAVAASPATNMEAVVFFKSFLSMAGAGFNGRAAPIAGRLNENSPRMLESSSYFREAVPIFITR